MPRLPLPGSYPTRRVPSEFAKRTTCARADAGKHAAVRETAAVPALASEATASPAATTAAARRSGTLRRGCGGLVGLAAARRHGHDLGRDRQRDLRRRAAAEVEPGRAVDALEVAVGEAQRGELAAA